MLERGPSPCIDTEARERIAELSGRLASHERHCDERHANLREFMAQIERETERIHERLGGIWRWLMSVMLLLVISLLGLASKIVMQAVLGH